MRMTSQGGIHADLLDQEVIFMPSIPRCSLPHLVRLASLTLLGGCASVEPLEVPESSSNAQSSWVATDTSSGEDALSSYSLDTPVTLPVTPPAGTESSSVRTIHTIQKGDTLFALARQYYADASRWRSILEANRDQIDNPDCVFVGQELVIPD